MNVENVVFDFYRDIYRDQMLETNELLGFSNPFFNNPIMTPCFSKSLHPNLDEFDKFHRLLNRKSSWINSFNKIINKTPRLNLQYTVMNQVLENKFDDEFHLSLRSGLSKYEENELKRKTDENSFQLEIETQNQIHQVLKLAKAEIEYMLLTDHYNIIGAVTIVHGEKSSLLINGFVDKEHRDRGLAKRIIAGSVNHCLGIGKTSVFYWTFNEKLQNKSPNQKNSFIYHLN